MKVSLVVLIGLLATRLLRNRSAAVRHFVLAAALVCAAATPSLRLVAPAWRANAGAWLTSSRVELIDRPLAVLHDETPALPVAADAAHPGAVRALALMRSLGIVWLAGVGASLFSLAVGLGRLAWLASRAYRVTDGPWASIAADVSSAYGLGRPLALLQSDHATLLFTWGFAHPKVLLPADAPGWPPDRIRIVLGHELAHVRRGDWIVQMAAGLLRSAYWFNPLLWIAFRQLRLESEQACDDAVLQLGIDGSAYASELVDLARACRSHRSLFVPAAAIARPSSLERRVRAMLNARLNRDPLTRSASLAAAILLAVVTVLVAGFGASAQSAFTTLSGSIVDPIGRPVPGATLTLTNPQSQSKYEIRSNPDGRYEFVGLPAGSYTLLVALAGFATIKREGIGLSGQPFEVNAAMKVGTVYETITVTEPADKTPPRPSQTSQVRARPRPGGTELPYKLQPDPCASSPLGGCIRPPTKIKDVKPVYPAGSAGTGGRVVLDGRIGVDGLLTGLQVASAEDPGFVTAALNAVNGWEFRPTNLDGQPIETRINITVNFVGTSQ